MMDNSLTILSELFNVLSSDSISKIAIIKKIPKGYWGIFSQKGKLLGKYKTKEQANKRLREIEYWKRHKKASEEITYSSLMRQLGKKYSPEILKKFRQVYKKSFDDALLKGEQEPEEIALQEALVFVNELNDNMEKVASAIRIIKQADELGTPNDVGIYLSSLIKFILRKINNKNRAKSILNLKNKILMLNEYELASKKMPPAASIGQSLVIIKHLLFGKDPNYIRAVLNSIARYL